MKRPSQVAQMTEFLQLHIASHPFYPLTSNAFDHHSSMVSMTP